MTVQLTTVGRAGRLNSGTTTPTAANANGKSTNAGRLRAVMPAAIPRPTNVRARWSSSVRTASHIVIENHSVVQTSVMTRGTKYGIGGNSAVRSAARHAVLSDVSRRATANTRRQ